VRAEASTIADGVRTGSAQSLGEITLTPVLRVTGRFLLRADLRTDWSNRAVFEREGRAVKDQSTALVSAWCVLAGLKPAGGGLVRRFVAAVARFQSEGACPSARRFASRASPRAPLAVVLPVLLGCAASTELTNTWREAGATPTA